MVERYSCSHRILFMVWYIFLLKEGQGRYIRGEIILTVVQ